jgi:hypothetical protein
VVLAKRSYRNSGAYIGSSAGNLRQGVPIAVAKKATSSLLGIGGIRELARWGLSKNSADKIFCFPVAKRL